MVMNLQVANDEDFEEIVGDIPNDTLQTIEKIDNKSKALEQAAQDFMKAHSASHEEVTQLRRQMWEDLARELELDVHKYVYTLVSYKGEPKVVKVGDV